MTRRLALPFVAVLSALAPNRALARSPELIWQIPDIQVPNPTLSAALAQPSLRRAAVLLRLEMAHEVRFKNLHEGNPRDCDEGCWSVAVLYGEGRLERTLGRLYWSNPPPVRGDEEARWRDMERTLGEEISHLKLEDAGFRVVQRPSRSDPLRAPYYDARVKVLIDRHGVMHPVGDGLGPITVQKDADGSIRIRRSRPHWFETFVVDPQGNITTRVAYKNSGK
ncbi:MAG: hypothetical protein HY078_12545 [Elusimicrobia bacterium]|nr:hypothetical protein [Elusimicrobiota bacterium]